MPTWSHVLMTIQMDVSFNALGHTNITGEHESTLEVTTDDYLTPAGDCIVGIESTMAARDLPGPFKQACQDSSSRIILALASDSSRVRIEGRGDEDLAFSSKRSMVVRTSSFIDDRTIMLEADHAAGDLPRALIDDLARGGELSCRLTVEP